MLTETIYRIKKTGLMGIVRVETIEHGVEIAQGCIDSSVDVLEISCTNSNTGGVVRALKGKFGNQLSIRTGTVLDPTAARLAIIDGAELIIASTFSKKVQRMTNLCQVPHAPGCTSYTEMIEALKAGTSFIKAFPISNYYGPDLTKVFRVPCSQIPIPANGGADFDNLHTWFENDVDSVDLGGLLTKGGSADTAEDTRKLRAIVEESREAD